MSTTTIRLDEELKARVAAAAKRAGKTAHAFIVDAIAQNVEQAEMEDQFDWDGRRALVEDRFHRKGRAMGRGTCVPGSARPRRARSQAQAAED